MNNSKIVSFFPLDKEFKEPTGAVRVNTPCRYRLKFCRPSNPEDVFLCVTKDGEATVRYPMHYVSEMGGEHVYETTLSVTSPGLYFYYFAVLTHSDEYRIVSDECLYANLGYGQEWQLTVYSEPYAEPKGFQGGVMYQILPDRFCAGGERLKTKPYAVYRDDWGGVPQYKPVGGKILNIDFFGGNLKGITKKLPYLKSLGVTVIYLNPIFEARSNHKYDTGCYKRVDSDFGSKSDLDELIKKAERKGIRLILDGVFSHTGDDSVYFNKYGNYDSVGAYAGEKSPYYDWYTFTDFEKRQYACWWDILILPAVNEENASYDEYINGEEGVARYWTQSGIGGWRLDVTDELPDAFLDRFVRAVKHINPNALILGEVWEDASNKIAYSNRRRYLNGGQLDSVMNYPFKESIISFVKTGDAFSLYRTVCVLLNNYPQRVLNSLMNILGTHDTVRILTELGDSGDISTKDLRANARLTDPDAALRKLKLATVLQYTLMGFPCVYYGDEAGLEGFEDPFNRRCYAWDNQNKQILKWYRRLGKIRSGHSALFTDGKYEHITHDDGVFAFKRVKDDTELTVIVNNGGTDFDFVAENATDLLTGKAYNGTVKSGSAVILKG